MIIFDALYTKKFIFSCDGCGKRFGFFETLKILEKEIDKIRMENEMLSRRILRFEQDYCKECRNEIIKEIPTGKQFNIQVMHDSYEELGIKKGDILVCRKLAGHDLKIIQYGKFQINLVSRIYMKSSFGFVDGRVLYHIRGKGNG